MDRAEVGRLEVDLGGRQRRIDELDERAVQPSANGDAVRHEHQVLLAHAREHAAQIQRGHRHAKDRRRVELAVDRHQVDELLRLVADVLLRQRRRVVGVEEQLDLERPLVAGDELDDRRPEARHTLVSEVVVLVEGVLLRVVEDCQLRPAAFVRDVELLERHG